MRIIGRKREQRELRRYCESGRPEFVVVYGRRRVGKTFLVREYFGNSFAFHATGIAGGNAAVQLRSFCGSIREHGGAAEVAKDWFDAFDQLKALLQRDDVPRDGIGGKRVVFIDEMPWLDTPRSNFRSALELFWNGWASAQPDILLIVCGSATSWVIKNLLKERGGLHNRVTGRLHLEPFTLGECEEYYRQNGVAMTRNQMIESYMVFGGIPFYLDLFDRRLGLVQNVDRLCFAPSGQLRGEFDELYRSLFKHADRHVKVVRALAKRTSGATRAEIERAAKIAGGGTLTETLDELEQCGFVRRYRDFTKPSRDAVYQLIDPFTLFYLRFMEGTDDERFWSNHLGDAGYRSWSGRAFELVCLLHTAQMKEALGISGISTSACAWRSATSGSNPAADPGQPADLDLGTHGPGTRGAQIDLLLDRADGVVNVCEMKFSQSEFVIDKAYDQVLRNKLAVFAAETGTHKALHLTMVTSCGVARNQYAGIVQSEIVGDDLFA